MNKNDLVISVRITKKMKEKIDVLVREGYFMNQSNFVRTAIRDLLEKY